MKKLLLIVLAAVVMAGCGNGEPERVDNNYPIIVIDSCEYIEVSVTGYAGGYIPIHKNDCRFCQERRKNEINEIIIAIERKCK